MAEVWLRSNRRALAMGMILPGAFAGVCAVAAGVCWSVGSGTVVVGGLAALAFVGFLGVAALAREMARPRLSYSAGQLLVHLGNNPPDAVPIEFVECFFLGQGPGMIRDRKGNEPEVSTVVVRLAERALDYKHRDVRAALGHWCEGYITLRGTWCETINQDQLKRMNQRLIEAHRAQRAGAPKTSPSPAETPA